MVSRHARWRGAVIGLVAALWLSASGCSPRDHDNLFDPDNPDTGGNPDIFAAVAGNGRVTLEWELPEYTDLVGFSIERRDAAGAVLTIDPGPGSGARSLLDTAVVNDSTYTYTLSTFFAGNASPVRGAPSPATPGRRVLWVLDQRSGNPTPVSPDARHVLARPGGTRIPSDLDILPGNGGVVTADFFERKVDRYDRDGARQATLSTGGQPLSVAMNPADSTVWIGIYGPSVLEHRSPSLTVLVSADSGIGIPEDIALDIRRGDVWVADSEGRLLHRRPDGSMTVLEGFDRPFSVAVDPATGDCWMADRGGAVFRVSGAADTVLFRNDAFAAPFQVISDGEGGAWVTDNAAGRIVRLDPAGTTITTLTDVRNPGGLARDPASGDLWVTDLRADQLVRISPTGAVLARLDGFSGPFEVRVAVPDP